MTMLKKMNIVMIYINDQFASFVNNTDVVIQADNSNEEEVSSRINSAKPPF